MLKNDSSEYKNIFRSTFAFGFVQLFNILTKVLLNKAAAIFLGVEGVGVIGIFQSTSQVFKTFFGFGVPQSAVRDIAKVNSNGNGKDLFAVISTTRAIIWFSSFVGFVVTIFLAPLLSEWSFGVDSYNSAFLLLSLVVFFGVLADGQLAILRGARKLKNLAMATLLGSVAGLVFGIPLYYFFGHNAIVPVLLVASISLTVFATYFVSKIAIEKTKVVASKNFTMGIGMVKAGLVLMLIGLAGMVSEYSIKMYVLSSSGAATVGIYQAGLTIVSGYFSVIIVAMMTDYYPRISEVHDDNHKLLTELNRQTKVGLILMTPLITTFVLLMPFFVSLLYSSDFLLSVDYMKYAIFWTLIVVVSNPIDMILVAKRNTKMILVVTLLYRSSGVLLSIYGFSIYGMEGLGLAMLVAGFLHFALVQGSVYKLHGIVIDLSTLKMLVISILLICLALVCSNLIESSALKYSLGVTTILFSFCYSIRNFNMITGFDLYAFLADSKKRLW